MVIDFTFSLARATTLKASFSSNRLISLISRLAFFKARGNALLGAIVKSIGAHAASAKAVVFHHSEMSYSMFRESILFIFFFSHTNNACQRLDTEFFSLLARHQDDGRRTIIERASIGSRHSTFKREIRRDEPIA